MYVQEKIEEICVNFQIISIFDITILKNRYYIYRMKNCGLTPDSALKIFSAMKYVCLQFQIFM